MTFKVMADGVEIDWSGVNVMVDGALAGAVYVHGEKVWPVAPPVTQALYVANPYGLLGGTSDVLMYPLDGPFVGPGLGLSVTAPILVAAGPDAVYVFDSGPYGGPNLIYRWDGSTQTTVPFTGLTTPAGVAVDANGSVYVADAGNSAVYRWDGSTQTTVPFTGLARPNGVAVDANGSVYVADSGNSAVYRWDGSTQTTVPFTGLTTPAGVAVDANGSVYVADQVNNGSVYRWDGSTQTTVPFTGLTTPNGVAVDANGSVYVADAGYGNLSRWDGTSQTTLIAGQANGQFAFYVAIGPMLT